MAEIKFYSVTEDKISEIEQQNGNIIFVRDSRKIILDSKDERVIYYTVISIPNENVRLLMTPVSGFYFVESTHILYRYTDEWIALNEPPTQIEFFVDSEWDITNPKDGALYITKSSIYRYVDGKLTDLTKQNWENI